MHYFSDRALIALVALVFYFGPIHGDNWEPCGDWTAYNDEKCFKIIDDTLRTFDEAKNVCVTQNLTSTLAVIRSSEEQQFLSDYLVKTAQKVENFWIGAQYSSQNGSFIWIDNSPLNYTNWDAGHIPQSLADYCIHMQADVRVAGKWKDGRCIKKNAVVCQRMQFWTTEFLQNNFLDSRKQQKYLAQNLANANQKIATQKETLQNVNQRIDELKQSIESSNTRINEQKLSLESANARIDEQKQNLVNANARIDEQKLSLFTSNARITEQAQSLIPIGFLYTQLPNEKDPTQIWPSMVWTDVSSQFSGVFFRVSGGGAESFGKVQGENSPQLTSAKYMSGDGKDKISIASGQCQAVRTGSYYLSDYRSVEFCMSSGEIRPRNMAVYIWKRTG